MVMKRLWSITVLVFSRYQQRLNFSSVITIIDHLTVVATKQRQREEEREIERSPRCQLVPPPPPLPLRSAPPGCPEGGSRRLSPTHHLSPEQPGGISFTLQSLPVYTTPRSTHTHSHTSVYYTCEDSAVTSIWFLLDLNHIKTRCSVLFQSSFRYRNKNLDFFPPVLVLDRLPLLRVSNCSTVQQRVTRCTVNWISCTD